MIFTHADLLAIEREACKRSLATFVREAWPVLETDEYVHGWHVDAICEHLEAITDGDINRLLINIPPGTMKSTLTSVFWPAWEWGPRGLPHYRFIGASHEGSLATRDARKMRLLVTSEWYQERWPVALSRDQSEKINFENEHRGFRQACPVRSMTGKRGHRIVWDDPHSAEGANSSAEREEAVRIFKETLPTRLVSPKKSAIIIVMQRLHEQDVSGEILAGDYGYEHLMLPMEFERDRRCTTSIGWSDPRQHEDELLFPGRFPRDVVERDKKAMGTFAVAGQFQQRPAPRSGGLFDWEKLEIVDATPRIVETVRYWDKAGTDGGGAWTAGVKMGRGVDDLFYILDVVRGQWGATKREAVIKQTAELDGADVVVWIEQEPGSGGKESAESTIANLAGYTIKAERATGEKAVRAEPYAVQVEAGNVKVLRGSWNKEFIDEHKTFPRGKYKDQCDAAGGGFVKLTRPAGIGVVIPKRYR